jgi:hypothetical protein
MTFGVGNVAKNKNTLCAIHDIRIWGFVRWHVYIVKCKSDYRRGFGLGIGFLDHLNTRLMATLNYSAIADLHTLQITTANANSFQYAVSSPVVPW